MIGRVLTRYKILEEVGSGGMAVVYKGLDTSLGREVAVKVLHPHLAGLKESRDRLEREAQAVAKLRHENILEIFDYSGPDSPESFIVTEYIHGPTLTAFLKDHPIRLPEVAAMIASEVARALEHAHGLGVIHRDVKPENVMIGEGGLVKLTDFGIAQIVDKERMTVTGQLLGSPAYMSPEHVEGGRLDFRTDVFACGILLYQLATGQLPFRGKNAHEVLKKIAECQYAPADQVNPLVSSSLAKIIGRALMRSPEARYPDVGAMRAALVAELSACGVGDPRDELRAFFAGPDGWEAAFRPRLVATLVAAGKRAAANGKTAAALAAWSRALTVDGECAEARALIDGLGQRRRMVRLAGAAAAFALVGAGALAVVHYAPGKPAAATASSTAPRPAPRAPAPAAPAPEKQPIRTAAARVDPRPRPPVLHAAPAAADRAVKVNVVQKNVAVWVDGRDAHYDGGPLRVGSGKHHLMLTARCCGLLEYDLDANATVTPPLKLPWKNGTLVVKTHPEGASVTATTEASPTTILATGGKLLIAFEKEFGDGQMKVFVTATKPGFGTRTETCIAVAGDTRDCAVELQRRGD